MAMTKKEARLLVDDLNNWKVDQSTDRVRVLTLMGYARVQILQKFWYFREGIEKPRWVDVWSGTMVDGVFGEQITIPRIAEKIWKQEKEHAGND